MGERKMRVDRITDKKAKLILIVFALCAVAILIVLFNMQILSYEDYQEKVINQMTSEIVINPDRGEIYDTNGNIIATNNTEYLVFIDPKNIDGALTPENANDEIKVYKSVSEDGSEKEVYLDELIARFLSENIEDADYDDIMERSRHDTKQYEVIAKGLNEEQADLIREFISEYKLTRYMNLVASSKRYYPYNDLASHVIGFTGTEGTGLFGLESYYNNIMEGTSGRYITAQDAHSNDMPFDYETFVDAEDGYNIVATLDVYIQYELENQLENALKNHGAANRVCGIVMDVDTGAILAMATSPSYDLNDPWTLDAASQLKLSEAIAEGGDEKKVANELRYAMWNNKAISETYEPGSTFKIITTAMGFEEKVVTVNDSFYCGGSMTVEGYPRPISCHKKTGHGAVTFARGLQQSCNPTLMTLGLRIGRERFYDYFGQFGYKDKTGIDLPAEEGPVYHSFKDFTIPSLAVYSFGQTFKVTPIQQITAIASVANGGKLVTPHFLKEITDDEGNVISSYETDVKRQVASEGTCQTITNILEEGVSGDGGARNAYVKGYKIAAKTGTSEKRDKADENGTFSLRVGSCVGYGPADDPKVAVLIVVDEPMNGSVFGSVVAAPYVSNMMSFILPYMGYEPTYTADELESVEVSLSNYVGTTVENATADLQWREIEYKVIGDGATVTSQSPAAGTSIVKQNGKVYLYTDGAEATPDITVPDLIGKSAEAANRMVTNLGLNISINGASNGTTAKVSIQSPAAGTVVAPGTTVTVDVVHQETSDG